MHLKTYLTRRFLFLDEKEANSKKINFRETERKWNLKNSLLFFSTLLFFPLFLLFKRDTLFLYRCCTLASTSPP